MPGADITISMTSHHDMDLVALSILIAIAASYVALQLAGRVTASAGRARLGWIWCGAVAMGVGIWSMHFVAMLAFRLPVEVRYDVPIVIFSMVAAVLASALALHLVSRPALGGGALFGGGVLMGAGIGVMHYSGMAAMRLPARLSYDPLLFLLSVGIAVVVSLVALWLAFHLRGETGTIGFLQRLVAALAMGGGIAGLHYTAMAAAQFAPTEAAQAAGEAAAAPLGLALGIGVATAAVLGLALAGSFLARGPRPADRGAGLARRPVR